MLYTGSDTAWLSTSSSKLYALITYTDLSSHKPNWWRCLTLCLGVLWCFQSVTIAVNWVWFSHKQAAESKVICKHSPDAGAVSLELAQNLVHGLWNGGSSTGREVRSLLLQVGQWSDGAVNHTWDPPKHFHYYLVLHTFMVLIALREKLLIYIVPFLL